MIFPRFVEVLPNAAQYAIINARKPAARCAAHGSDTMKKILTLLLALAMTLTLLSCGTADAPQPEAENSSQLGLLDEDPTEAPDEQSDAPQQEQTPQEEAPAAEPEKPEEALLDEHGSYTSKDDVALYIHQYGHLPDNFITKKEAEALGWSGGSLEKYAPGMSIGGSHFGNYEGLLPEKKGRSYTECDIDTLGAKSRGAKRIVFSNDGLIYYTDDHYESFTLLYGEE